MKVFVYGTLMRGFGNWSWALKDRAQFIGEAETSPNFTLLDLGAFPGMVEGSSVVQGEVFEFDDDDVLRDLDRLEGHPGMYRRTPITVVMADGNEADVETYIYQHGRVLPSSPVVESGSWRQATGRPIPEEVTA